MKSNSFPNQESLIKVFQLFDKDSDGYIDISEIHLAAKELNIPANEQSIKSMFFEIDQNHDGRISFEEFSTFLSFDKAGADFKEFNFYKLKALSYAKKAKSTLSKLPATFESGFQTHQVTVNFGSGELGTKLDTKVHYGLASREHFEHLSKGLGYDDNVNAIVLKLHSDNAENAKFGLKELIENTLDLLSAVIPNADKIISFLNLSYHNEEDYILVGITGKHPLVQESIQSVFNIVSSFVNDEFTATLDFQVGLKHDLKDLFEKSKFDGVPLVVQVLQGLLIHFHFKCNSQLPKQLLHMYLAQFNELTNVPKPVRKWILLALLVNSKFEVNFNEGDVESLIKTLESVGLDDLSSLSLYDLIRGTKDSGITDMATNIPAVVQAIDFAKENLKANFTIGVRGPKSLVTVHFKTNGVKEIVNFLFS